MKLPGALHTLWNLPDPPVSDVAVAPAHPAPDDKAAHAVTAVITLVVCLSAVRWALTDVSAPLWDQARHGWNALRLLENARAVAGQPLLWPDLWVWHDQQYPVLPYVLPALVQAFSGPSFLVCQLVMACVWTPMLLLSVAALAARAHGSAWAGACAALWVSASPMVLDLSKDFLLDLPVLSSVALACWAVVRCGFFLRRNESFAAGLALGAMMLTKAAVPLSFVVGVLFCSVVSAAQQRAWKAWARNVALGVVGALCVCGPFMVQFLQGWRQMVGNQARDAAAEGDPTSWLPSALMYARWIPSFHMSAGMTLVLLLGVWGLRRAPRGVWLWAAGSVLVAWVVWPFFPNKDARYPLGWLATGSVVAAAAVNVVAPRVLAGALGLNALLMVTAVHWGVPFLPQRVEWKGVTLFAQHGYLRGAPVNVPNVADALVERASGFAVATVAQRRPLLGLMLGTDEGGLNVWNVTYAAWVHGRAVELVPGEPGPDVELLIHTRCNPGQPAAPDGWKPLMDTRTPDGCPAQLLHRPARVEALAHAEGLRLEKPVACEVGLQRRVVTHAGLVQTTGEAWQLVVVEQVERNRRPRLLQHTLRGEDGRARADWVTSDDHAQVGGTMVSVVSLEGAPREHERLTLTLAPEQGPSVCSVVISAP